MPTSTMPRTPPKRCKFVECVCVLGQDVAELDNAKKSPQKSANCQVFFNCVSSSLFILQSNICRNTMQDTVMCLKKTVSCIVFRQIMWLIV